MKKLMKFCLLITAALFAAPELHAQLSIGISISANIAPPALPVYVQPDCPADGYLWQPGYWAWDPDVQDYYWVPGVWIAPPQPGLLWTPAYWGFAGGVYGFHAGYWGPHVGFYGGINYGGGYLGIGFAGGAWQGNSFRYNTAVVNVNRTVVHNTYIDRTVIVNHTVVNNHTSFNGPGGVAAKPNARQLAAMKETHTPPTANQVAHAQHAQADKSQFSKANGGKPANVAMNKVGGQHFTPQGKKAPQGNIAAEKPIAPKTDNAVKPQAGKPAAANPEQVNKPANNAAAKQQRKAPQQRMQRKAPQPKPHAPPKHEDKQ